MRRFEIKQFLLLSLVISIFLIIVEIDPVNSHWFGRRPTAETWHDEDDEDHNLQSHQRTTGRPHSEHDSEREPEREPEHDSEHESETPEEDHELADRHPWGRRPAEPATHSWPETSAAGTGFSPPYQAWRPSGPPHHSWVGRPAAGTGLAPHHSWAGRPHGGHGSRSGHQYRRWWRWCRRQWMYGQRPRGCYRYDPHYPTGKNFLRD